MYIFNATILLHNSVLWHILEENKRIIQLECINQKICFYCFYMIMLPRSLILDHGLGQVEDVSNFIKDNAQRLLSVEEALVYPVSARQALQAKISASLEDGSIDVGRLSQDPLWTTSGFQQLEDFIFTFMGASTERGAERLRLKLETPLGIGAALLAACDRQLVAEALKAESDLKALADVQKQLERYEQAMLNDAILQRQRALAEVILPVPWMHGLYLSNI
jgi:hypothetical protein